MSDTSKKRKRRKTTVKIDREGLTRRERLYLAIIGRMVSRNLTFDNNGQREFLNGVDTPEDSGFYLDPKYEVGDLVLAYTSIGRKYNKWVIAVAVSRRGSDCVLRDIFTQEEVNYGNESFYKLVGVPFEVQLPDDQFELWTRFKSACYEVDDYHFIPCFVTFAKDDPMYITRQKWTDDTTTHSFPVEATKEAMEGHLRYVLAEYKIERDKRRETQERLLQNDNT